MAGVRALLGELTTAIEHRLHALSTNPDAEITKTRQGLQFVPLPRLAKNTLRDYFSTMETQIGPALASECTFYLSCRRKRIR